MVFKTKGIKYSNVIMLMVLWSHSCISILASTSHINGEILGQENATANSQDQQVSSQYYRPYYFNRRPGYNHNQRPSHSNNYRPNTNGNNQRSTYNSAVSPNNYRPTTRKPTVSNNVCPSSSAVDSNQGNWICWDQTNQRLRMGPNLTIEKFVIFYAQLASGPIGLNEAFRQQLCEQSKRFNNVGIICVEYLSHSSGEYDCPSNANKFPEICTANSDVCVCVTDQYSNIASQNMSPEMSSFFSPSVISSNTITASNLNQFFPSSISSNTITASNLNQFFPSWMLPYINTQYLLP